MPSLFPTGMEETRTEVDPVRHGEVTPSLHTPVASLVQIADSSLHLCSMYFRGHLGVSPSSSFWPPSLSCSFHRPWAFMLPSCPAGPQLLPPAWQGKRKCQKISACSSKWGSVLIVSHVQGIPERQEAVLTDEEHRGRAEQS